ncbi:MAG: D-glycero-beta-D-manno-heptose 1,7-bisphosphate 7-phosphatase [Aestuariibacter sp.]
MKKKAIFLDRDGVINIDFGYTSTPEDFNFYEGVFAACRRFQSLGYALVVVTNQSGIARGYYSEADFEILCDWMLNQFLQEDVDLTAIYHCPHHATEGQGEFRKDCNCRKPKPGMLLAAASEHNIDLSQSIMIGDKISDMEAGRAAGVKKCILIEESDVKDKMQHPAVDDVAKALMHVRI